MSRRRNDYERGNDYDDIYQLDDEEEPSGFIQTLASFTRNPVLLSAMAIFAFFAVTSDSSNLASLLLPEKDTRYAGRLPNSLLTLNYPYTLLRGVVSEQPVQNTDVPFFWHPHNTDAQIVQKVLSTCYGVETIELDSLEAIQKAKAINLPSRKATKFAISSPYLREVAEIFTPDNLGRTVCFLRHPLDYDLHDSLPGFEQDDNWMIRFLLRNHVGRLGFKELGEAKQIIREICVVATIDKLSDSIKRSAEYLGWPLEGSDRCVEEVVEEDAPRERYLDHDSQEWQQFYGRTKYDCQLYEFAQQVWRAQIQTIIPLSLQNQRWKALVVADEDEEE